MQQTRFRSSFLRTVALFVCALQVAAILAVVIQPAGVALAASTIEGIVYEDLQCQWQPRYQPAHCLIAALVQISLATDRGVGGVTITVYDSDGNIAGTINQQPDGSYSLSATGSGPYRVEFTTLPPGFQPGPVGPNNGTTVRFLSGAASGIDLGIVLPSEYCQNNPFVGHELLSIWSRRWGCG